MDDGLGDLRTDAADHAFGAHEARGGHGLKQMLGRPSVNHGNAGNVDDGEIETSLDDGIEPGFP